MKYDRDPINEGIAQGAQIIVGVLILAFLAFLIYANVTVVWEFFT